MENTSMNNLTPSESPQVSNPAPVIDGQNPWKIKKVITDFEQSFKMLVLQSADISKHVFQHWLKGMVRVLEGGTKQQVILWDVTEENNSRDCGHAYVQMMPCEDYALVCADLFTNRGLNVGDEIGIYWDTSSCDFKFKLIEKGLFL